MYIFDSTIVTQFTIKEGNNNESYLIWNKLLNNNEWINFTYKLEYHIIFNVFEHRLKFHVDTVHGPLFWFRNIITLHILQISKGRMMIGTHFTILSYARRTLEFPLKSALLIKSLYKIIVLINKCINMSRYLHTLFQS